MFVGCIMSIFKKYLSETSGNFAIMFGLGSAMLAMGMAVAIDLTGMHGAKKNLQENLDSAALLAVIEVARSGVQDGNKGKGDHNRAYKDIVMKALDASGVDYDPATLVVELRDESLSVTVNKDHDLMLGGLLNKSSTNIGAQSIISLPSSGAPVEVALVLDNTESMNYYGKMTALKEGARDFINAIEDSNSGSKIALVPFARYVDIGVDKRNEPWLEVPEEYDTDRTWQQATHTGGTCHTETRTRHNDGIEESYETEVCTGQTKTYETQSTVVESRWIGCVGVRSDGLHMLDDSYTTPTTRIQGLLHRVPHEETGFGYDEESWCPHTVTPLTDDYAELDKQIGKLYGTDRTYIPIGLNWGRRILSPKAPFTEADTVKPKRQIMILMSDGANTGYLDDDDGHESIPYVQDLRSQEQADGVIPPGTNEDTAALCESIKSEGIEMFTIAFRVENSTTESLLMNCASSPQHYFDAESNESLVQSFQNISESLESDIRLMQ